MPEQLQKILKPIKSRWDALTRDQKIKLVAAAAIVAFAIGLTLFLALRTRYEEFVNGLDSSRLSPLETALTDEGIKFRRTKGGTALEVDRNKITDAMVVLETTDATTNMAFTYADALQSITMGTTETTARRSFILAKETQLESVLANFSGVRSAEVTLEIPENIRLFIPTSLDEKSRASAQLNVEYELNQEMGASMARLLCRSVEGLEMENIEITDQEGRTVYSGIINLNAESSQGSAAELQAQERAEVINSIRSTFMPKYFNDAQVAVNLIYDNVSESTSNSTVRTYPDGADGGVPLHTETEESSGENTAPADAPGTDANNAQTPGYATGEGDSSSFDISKGSTDFGYDETVIQKVLGPSTYDRTQSSISVVLGRFVYHSQELMMRDNPVFTDLDWKNFKNTTNGNVITDDPAMQTYINLVVTATGLDASRITLVLMEIPVFEDFIRTPIDIPLIIALSLLGLLLLMLAFALIRRQKIAEEEEEAEPELSVEDLLVSTQLEEAKEEAEKLEEIDYAKESEVKKQIEKFVNEKPEAVAALLRNWLNTEDW